MSLRDKFTADLKDAMKGGEKTKVAAIRLITAALKDRDIQARGEGKTVSDEDILALLQKMVKSRQESLEIYEKNNRPELAAQEKGEIDVISAYLPKQMDEVAVAEGLRGGDVVVGRVAVADRHGELADLLPAHLVRRARRVGLAHEVLVQGHVTCLRAGRR